MRTTDNNLANALGEKSQEYFSLCNNKAIQTDFAKNSKFHNEIMSDGYVFNPYIHRRWLPAQYWEIRDLIKKGYYGSWEGYLYDHYKLDYIIDYLKKETHKLAFLNRVNKIAFEERSKFFTVDIIKNIYEKYLLMLKCRFSAMTYCWVYGNNVFIEYYGHAKEEWIERSKTLLMNYHGRYVETTNITLGPLLMEIDKEIEALKKAETYYELCKIIDKLPKFKKTDYCVKNHFRESYGREEFYKAFLLSGAYYTCKNFAMFNSKSFYGKIGAEACQLLRGMLDAGATFEEFDNLLN